MLQRGKYPASLGALANEKQTIDLAAPSTNPPGG
jgi:hypothetical protein